MSALIDPFAVRIEIQLMHSRGVAPNAYCDQILQHNTGAEPMLFDVNCVSSGRFKFTFFTRSPSYSERLVTVVMTSDEQPTVQVALGVQLKSGYTFMVRMENFDRFSCDAYASVRYTNDSDYDMYNRKFHRSLEEKLDGSS